MAENKSLKKSIEKYQVQLLGRMKEFIDKAVKINDIRFISGQIETDSTEVIKNVAYQLRDLL